MGSPPAITSICSPLQVRDKGTGEGGKWEGRGGEGEGRGGERGREKGGEGRERRQIVSKPSTTPQLPAELPTGSSPLPRLPPHCSLAHLDHCDSTDGTTPHLAEVFAGLQSCM